MFYGLKKRIITKAVEKRNKKASFNYNDAERYELSGSDPLTNNSYYFSGHNQNNSFYCRLGKRVDKEEVWLTIYLNGEAYTLKEEVFKDNNSPLKVSKSDNWNIEFIGIVVDGENVNHKLKLNGEFIDKFNPINFGSDMPSYRMGVAMAQHKWNKDFFENVKKIQGQTHYEQEGVLNLNIELDGKEHLLNLPCVRDHSFGKRDWDYMNNHLWIMAINGEKQLNFSMVSYPALKILEVGNFRLGEKEQKFMKEAHYDRGEVVLRDNPNCLKIEYVTEDGFIHQIESKIIHKREYSFEGVYFFLENIAEFIIDGEIYRGILEIGFNKEEKRAYNGENIRGLKA